MRLYFLLKNGEKLGVRRDGARMGLCVGVIERERERQRQRERERQIGTENERACVKER